MSLPPLPFTFTDQKTGWRQLVEKINNILNFTFDDSRARTAAEIALNVTPADPAYLPGDVRRYGALCNGDDNDTAAINTALLCNNYVWITGTSVASGIKMQADGQILFGIGRNSGIIAANNTTPCITLAGNRQVVRDLILGTGALATNDTNLYTITGITRAANAVVTVNQVSAANPFIVGQQLYFLNVLGMTQMNTQTGVVSAIGGSSGAWTATVPINSTAYTAYSSSGTVSGSNFAAVLLQFASRALVQGITTSGVWCYGIDLESALYSTVTYCNIDGFRKRGVSITGGGDNRVLFNMVFDGSLVSPTDAHIFMTSTPSIHVRDNLITRSSAAAGPAIYAFNLAGTFTGQLLWITDNTIDFGQGWSIQVDGVWNTHIHGNWCSWGQNAGISYGQIRVDNCSILYIRDNDINGSLLQGLGIVLTNCTDGVIAGNTLQYNYNNLVVNNCSNMIVSENISGQLTGLPPTGVPTQNSYVEQSCAAGCQVYWVNNISVIPQVAAYSGITNTVVATQGYSNSGLNIQTANYTLKITDRNGQVAMNTTATTLTLPQGVFAAGDKVTVMSLTGAAVITIAPGSSMALFWANGTTTGGSRTLTGVGYATIEFYATNLAIISGTGVT